MQTIIFLAWLFGFLALNAGIFILSSPVIDTRISVFLNQHNTVLGNKESREKFYEWLYIGLMFGWFLLIFYLFGQYLSNNPID